MYIGIHEKLFLHDFNEISILSDFQNLLKYQISRKPIQRELGFSMQTDGQAETHR